MYHVWRKNIEEGKIEVVYASIQEKAVDDVTKNLIVRAHSKHSKVLLSLVEKCVSVGLGIGVGL